MVRLRTVTYNVHKCRGLDGRASATRIAGVLGEIGADVIALQEVLEHQAETISHDLASGSRWAKPASTAATLTATWC